VAVLAVRASFHFSARHPTTISSRGINLSGNFFEVIWIHASAHPAEMVYFKRLYGIPTMLKIERGNVRG
jgi:hypothetical protein